MADNTVESVTELKRLLEQSRAALHASEARFRNVIARSADGIVIVNQDGVVQFANPAAEVLFGRPAASLVGQVFGYPLVNGGRTELDLLQPGGELGSAEMRVTITEWEGRPAMLASLRDTSERRWAEEELRRSARLNELLLDTLPHPAMLVRHDRTILAANRIAREAGAVVGGYCWRDFGHTQYLPAEQQQYLQEHPGEPPPACTQCTFCLADPAHVSGTPTNDPEVHAFGRLWDTWWVPIDPETYLHYAIDVTERKRTENALRQIVEGTASATGVDFFRSLVHHLASALQVRFALVAQCVDTPVTRVRTLALWTGEAFGEDFQYDLTGTPCEEVLGGETCFHPDGVQSLFPMDLDLARMGAQSYLGTPLVGSSGSVIGHMAVLDDRPMGDRVQKESIIRIFAARAGAELERKQAEEALRRQTQELERSNAELERFAYVASHDLQEPLRMVGSYVQLLARRYQGRLDADADEFIAYAVDGVTRMQDLIHGLLAYARVGTQGKEPAPTDCNALIERTLAALRVTIDHSGAQVTCAPLPVVMGDALQLGQVFQNLISNALKFRGERPPQVHISATHLPPTSHFSGWLFSIQDNGIGIDLEYAGRIFEIFQRLHTRQEYPGTGIGLAICKKIVERHGGRIWFESQPGEGTTFYFTLPE